MIVKILSVDKLHGAVYLPVRTFEALARAVRGGAKILIETDTARISIPQNQIRVYRINKQIVVVQTYHFYNLNRIAVEISQRSVVFRDLSDLSIYTFLTIAGGAGEVLSPPPTPPGREVKIRLSRKYRQRMIELLNQIL